MRTRIAIVVALMLLFSGVGWTVHRIARLEDDAAGSGREFAVDPAPRLPAGSVPTPTLDAQPRLAIVSPAVDAALAARIAALEKRFDALEQRDADDRALSSDAKAVLDEIRSERILSNETAVVATLRNIISAEAQFQQGAQVDTDHDGTGEYGGFYEMSDGGTGRLPAGTVLTPPVLSGAFRALNGNGEVMVSRSGYFIRIFLPNASGAGVGEPQTGYTAAMVNADLSETTWCSYAWPVNYAQSGNRTFFTNQGGDVLVTENNLYSGTGGGPAPDAAFLKAGTITGRLAIGVTGADGLIWKQVD